MTVTSVIAHMREAAEGSREIGTTISREVAGLLTSFADRLQSAHDAEVGALRVEIALLESHAEKARALLKEADNEADAAESRLREAERDAGLLAASLATALHAAGGVDVPYTMQLIQKWDHRTDRAIRKEETNNEP